MKLSNYKQKYADMILGSYQGRQVVSYAVLDRVLEAYLKEKGVDIVFTVYRKQELCDGKSKKHAEILKNQSDKFYVISTAAKNNPNETQWMKEYGYEEQKDFCFMGVQSNVVPHGSSDWHDEKGNFCSYCPDNCDITFFGHNGKVIIPKNVQITNKLRIDVNSDCIIEIGEKCFFGNSALSFKEDCGTITIGNNVRMNDVRAFLYSNSSISIGDNTTFIEAYMSCCCCIDIGKDCMFSQKIVLFAGDGHAIFDTETGQRLNYPEVEKNEFPPRYTLKLGDHVWIGISAQLLNGTEIGSGSIVGMGGGSKRKISKQLHHSRQPCENSEKECDLAQKYMGNRYQCLR